MSELSIKTIKEAIQVVLLSNLPQTMLNKLLVCNAENGPVASFFSPENALVPMLQGFCNG